LNYRHHFHAGNFADVFKHAILALMIERLKEKDRPFVIIDSHAGAGRYDLAADAALRTSEYRDGILKLLADRRPDAVLKPYLDVIHRFNPGLAGEMGIMAYPGSPAIARAMLRPEDRLIAVELHPDDGAALARLFAGDRQVTVRLGDGFEALKALLPPPSTLAPRRGFVLIDPPYEEAGELERAAKALLAARQRWPTGRFGLWYPLKDRGAVSRFHAQLRASGQEKLLRVELRVRAPEREPTLFGCGMILLDPPWGFDAAMRTLMAGLRRVLGQDKSARSVVDWLSVEPADPTQR
jgi:23S rRNA (adenine2030-N6)-methyltransferase